MKDPTAKPTLQDCLDAVEGMAGVIPYFTKQGVGQRIIAAAIEQFINTNEELEWLMLRACGHIADWEKAGGLMELRGMFCTRFKPADGIVTGATSPGFSGPDLERQHEAEVRAENDLRLEEYRRKAELMAPEDRKPFELPPVKKIS